MQQGQPQRGFDYSAMLKANGVARVRCPKCFKLFAIHASEIGEARPKFQCSGCEQKFWIAFPEIFESSDATIGFPLEWIEPATAPAVIAPIAPATADSATAVSAHVESKSSLSAKNSDAIAQQNVLREHHFVEKTSIEQYQCPKCSAGFSAADKECSKCGIVFEKFYQLASQQAKLSQRVDATKEIKFAWDDVIQNFEDFSVHQRFLNQCFTENCLEFASAKYADILSACPTDELALKAQKQIEAFTTIQFESLKQYGDESEKPLWQRVNWSKFKASYVLLFVSVALIAVGLTSPYLRNLVGFGSSILFILVALRFYFRAI